MTGPSLEETKRAFDVAVDQLPSLTLAISAGFVALSSMYMKAGRRPVAADVARYRKLIRESKAHLETVLNILDPQDGG